MTERSKYSLIGAPDDEGVLNVGGRLGAALGPDSFRKIFSRFSGKRPVVRLGKDLGDVKTHRHLADWVRKAHQDIPLSIVVGGGHDLAFGHLLGLSEATGRELNLGCINIDAHLDVRKPNPKITSGSPFYLAIEEKVITPSRLVEFGIQSHCNSPALWEYVEKKKIEVILMEKLRDGKAVPAFCRALRKLAARCDQIMVSFDLDAVACAHAPGVSAPQTEGFHPSEILRMMEFAGRMKKVISLGIYELNPLFDVDQCTARLAATSAYHFLDARIAE